MSSPNIQDISPLSLVALIDNQSLLFIYSSFFVDNFHFCFFLKFLDWFFPFIFPNLTRVWLRLNFCLFVYSAQKLVYFFQSENIFLQYWSIFFFYYSSNFLSFVLSRLSIFNSLYRYVTFDSSLHVS